jgi:hypothetical protein
MEAPPEPTQPAGRKRFFFWTYFVGTPVMIVLLYFLSFGPVYMMWSKRKISHTNQFVNKLYTPLAWAYQKTPLHKPLGLYLHLWAPDDFDQNGDVNVGHK